MPTVTKTMKLAITSSEEILSLIKILNELTDLHSCLNTEYLENVDLSKFKILKNFDTNNAEKFLEQILNHLGDIHHLRILWNADALLKNAADLAKDTLDFHPDIKRGLELLELQKKGKIFLKD